MASTELEVGVPKGFRIKTVVTSHGWYDLPPFEWDERAKVLSLAARLADRVADIHVSQPRTACVQARAAFSGRPNARVQVELRAAVERVLGLLVNVKDFYRAAGADYQWAKKIGAGPFLSAPTVYEDAVKMLATTNCGWSLTRQMITRLVDRLGDAAPSGRRAFPTAEQMAQKDVAFYRGEVRAGYRARYFKDFADQVAARELRPEEWRQFPGSYRELVSEIRRAPGLGRYAAENLAKLLGRFDGLGIDSWCLRKFPRVRGPVRGDVTKAIERFYAKHGEWKGLALWLDLTRDWHETGIESDPTVVLKNT